jgi:hypothetical protein
MFTTPAMSAVADDAPAGHPDAMTTVRLPLTVAPNPFREELRFSVTAPSHAGAQEVPQWTIYDPLGRRVAGGTAEADSRGTYQARWNGRRQGGLPADAGVYYLEVRSGGRFAREVIVRLPG